MFRKNLSDFLGVSAGDSVFRVSESRFSFCFVLGRVMLLGHRILSRAPSGTRTYFL